MVLFEDNGLAALSTVFGEGAVSSVELIFVVFILVHLSTQHRAFTDRGQLTKPSVRVGRTWCVAQTARSDLLKLVVVAGTHALASIGALRLYHDYLRRLNLVLISLRQLCHASLVGIHLFRRVLRTPSGTALTANE